MSRAVWRLNRALKHEKWHVRNGTTVETGLGVTSKNKSWLSLAYEKESNPKLQVLKANLGKTLILLFDPKLCVSESGDWPARCGIAIDPQCVYIARWSSVETLQQHSLSEKRDRWVCQTRPTRNLFLITCQPTSSDEHEKRALSYRTCTLGGGQM